MLITCTSCSKQIKVADSAAGKRVKCPRCATIVRIPAAEAPEESETPAPPPPEEAPAESPETEPAPVGTEMTIVPKRTLAGKKALVKTMPGRRDDDDDAVEEDEPKSKPKRSSRHRDDDDDDDDEDRRPVKKRRRGYDDEDDDDHVDIRRQKRRGREAPGANGMAIASMILGICAVVSYLGMWACSPFGGPFASIPCGLALVLAIVGVILGHIGKTPGSEGFAITGLICSYIVLALFLLSIILVVVLVLIFGVAIAALGQAGPRPGPPPRRF